ncbi:MAG TPA: hypothetical protein VFI49_08340 [Rudaea sp.]|nr:hypothetical protein [Rudaea sp.]
MRYLSCVLTACLLGAGSVLATPLGSDFTYQGQLTDNGSPASGHYDLQFALFVAASGGSAVDIVTLTDQTISGGSINASLDFTDAPYNGQALWVEVSVRHAASGSYVALAPRQAITATPYALFALSGNPGPMGPVGPQGSAGSTGAAGAQGVAGPTGPQGAAGFVTLPYSGSASSGGSPALQVQNTTNTGVAGLSGSGTGVYGTTEGSSGQNGAAGVWGDSHDYYGVWGTSVANAGTAGNSTNAAGVAGASVNNDGVVGSGTNGVHGISVNGWGVWGHSTNGDGVHGETANPSGTKSGVAGFGDGGNYGVYGASTSGAGVSGNTQSGSGVVGTSVSGNGGFFISNLFAVSGYVNPASTQTLSAGIYAQNSASSNAGSNFVPGVYGVAAFGPSVIGYRQGSNLGPTDIANGVHGVVGITDTPNGTNPNIGVLGENLANGPGVYAKGTSGPALYATNSGAGLAGPTLNILASATNGIAIVANANTGDTTALFANGNALGQIFKGLGPGGQTVFRVTSNGVVYADGGYASAGADVAEFVPSTQSLEPGDVVEIDAERGGEFRLASSPSSTSVAGVISTQPGLTMNSSESAKDQENHAPRLALIGRVPVKASSENGAIRAGDLLVSSSTPGRAMRAPNNPQPGTVIGKAMRALDRDSGEIEMLVMLR